MTAPGDRRRRSTFPASLRKRESRAYRYRNECTGCKENRRRPYGSSSHLINTHADPDHISGNGAFAEVYMSPAEEENYRNFGGKCEILPVKEGDEFDLGGRILRVIDLPGHTPGSIAILDVENRVLISGDTVSDSNIFMFGPMRNLDRYIDSLEHLSELQGQFDEIYPMHGSFPASPDLIGKLIEGAKEIQAGKAEGKEVEFYGNKALLYKFPYAGLLCDLK